MRSINIDIDSVHFLSHDEVVKFASSAFLKDYIDQMVAKLGDINKDKITILDERKLTNIGIFRYYMDAWIEANPDINTNMTHMVRHTTRPDRYAHPDLLLLGYSGVGDL